jgi:hypothetical protein
MAAAVLGEAGHFSLNPCRGQIRMLVKDNSCLKKLLSEAELEKMMFKVLC